MKSFNKRYLIVRNEEEKVIKYMEYDPSQGYQVKPKGNVKLEDTIHVDKMVLISPSLISKMVTKKANKRIEYILKLINFIDANDDEAPDAITLGLDQASKFRQEIINKYRNYLSEEEQSLLENKIAILEDELKLRRTYLNKENIVINENKRSR